MYSNLHIFKYPIFHYSIFQLVYGEWIAKYRRAMAIWDLKGTSKGISKFHFFFEIDSILIFLLSNSDFQILEFSSIFKLLIGLRPKCEQAVDFVFGDQNVI